MTDAEISAYLDARDEWAMLTTIGKDGFPHTVALGYFRVGDDLYLGMRDHTQKVKNVERNPRVSVLVTASKTKGEVTGVMIQGDASIVRDDTERLALAREAARQRGIAEAELLQAGSRAAARLLGTEPADSEHPGDEPATGEPLVEAVDLGAIAQSVPRAG